LGAEKSIIQSIKNKICNPKIWNSIPHLIYFKSKSLIKIKNILGIKDEFLEIWQINVHWHQELINLQLHLQIDLVKK